MNAPNRSGKLVLVPVMLCFFAMGFVDLVGIASNYVKADLGLSDTVANVLPSLVFFWFLVLSVPTGILMNRIGRKRTVLLSLVVTVVSLLLPVWGSSFLLMLVSFSLLGIGNALMQTSLNPLVSSVIGQTNLASTLTFGQFIKAIASFMAPYIAMWGATAAIPDGGLGWRVIFPVYMAIGLLASVGLAVVPLFEENNSVNRSTSILSCFKLLGHPVVFLSFWGIMCHVGIDVGTNTTAPKLLMERLGMGLNEAASATAIYFLCRTVGCLTGSFILRKTKQRAFFVFSVGLMCVAMVGMFLGHTKPVLYTAIALVGYGNSNIFPLIFSQALLSEPNRQNEVSGLMIMGLFGGTVFPLLMGFASDAVGQVGAVAVITVGVLYLLVYSKKTTFLNQ